MGPTVEELNKVLQIKKQIKQSIINKGVEITDTTPFAAYPSKIDSIEVGGGGDPFYETMWNYITNNGTDYSYLFHKYDGKSLDLSGLDTSKAINMEYMFYLCTLSSFPRTVDLSGFNTSKVTTMAYMFYNCSSFDTLDLSGFDTSKVTTMTNMFFMCMGLKTIEGISNWDISSLTNMNGMFGYCSNLISLDLSNWDVSKVTGVNALNNTFNNCAALVDFKAPKNISMPTSVSNSTALSHDSLMSIINNLITTTSSKKLTLGSTNLAKLTDEEKAIATSKGWTLA